MDVALRRWAEFVRWLVDAAPSERAFLEAFFLFIYTARAQNDGTVDSIIEDAMAFAYKQSPADTQRTLEAFLSHRGTGSRLPTITAPALVLAGGLDPTARPELGRAVADAIPGSLLEVLECDSHQPFQEIPGTWNARVDAFWQTVEAGGHAAPRPREAPEPTHPAARIDASGT